MRTRHAFTAIETLVAIVLLLLLSTALTGFLFDVQSSRERLSTMGEERLAGALVIDALEESARFCLVRGPEGAGVVGDRTSLRIASRRASIESASPNAEALRTSRDLEISWDEDSGVLSMDGEPITDRVMRAVLRYHDGSAWVDAYNSQVAGTLPAAIEIALWFGEPEATAADEFGLPSDLDLGEGFGLPTPAELRALDGPVRWGEPDRRRIVAIPRLRGEDAS